MDLLTILLLAVGLAMDAFAVSVCKGLAMKSNSFKKSLIIGAWFGGFQALMPMIGYILGIQFEKLIDTIAPWIAFVLLAVIGGNMIREAVSGGEEEESDTIAIKEMFILAVATSIDALAIGITFACVPVSIVASLSGMLNTIIAVIIIGVVTYIISVLGVKIGGVFGSKYKNKAEFAGGFILIMLGVKIILEHFNVF